nr:uncharacterized protein LOC106615417 [Bactrocera oleae]
MPSVLNWIHVIVGVCLLLSLVSNTSGKSITDDNLAQTSVRKVRSAQQNMRRYPPTDNVAMPQQVNDFLGGLEYEFRKEYNRPGSPYRNKRAAALNKQRKRA